MSYPKTIDQAVEEYRGLVEATARKLVNTRRARSVGAEYDDLVQEGFISVWQGLQRGITPAAEPIERRMKDWIKYLGRQTPIAYETILPMEDLQDVEAR